MIWISKPAYNMIVDHARSERPNEACGIMAGAKNERTITRVFRCINVDEHPGNAYTIDPTELLKVTREIETTKSDLELIGFYHSHPYSSPEPSSIDRERAAWGGFLYLIYSIPAKDLGCWRWMEKSKSFAIEEVKIL